MADDGEPVIEDSTNLTQDDDRVAKLTHFPQTRVRNMMKLDPDLHLANKESVFLLTRATELFVEYFAKEAYKKTVIGKRKTIQKKDLDATVDEKDEIAFLEGVLE
ncbi:DNA polymerase epsilon subunit 4 [Exaiptasia diaphana]|uniref:Transcription factor CBF/NF-Y/archaeal histone domain-containing protein n=1 Tax=Exaiptasia diaphana TaxID=2652724 RepID=A0A913YBK5_EXADI|nr:DNA polymerase epsilon subunit 4 [Exaiptasia diaphana]KXJ19540.1 DNA polymerase epsilon subunit 4 [Exaiptasia diaphana]